MRRSIDPFVVRAGLWAAALGLLVVLYWPINVEAQDDGQHAQTHVVLPGETAVGIAARYGVSLAQLVTANRLHSLEPPAGTQLVIPVPDEAGRIHLVQYWETLPLLAARFGVPVVDILQANGMLRSDGLYVGQRLIIPGPSQEDPPGFEPVERRSLFALPRPPAPAVCFTGCAQITIASPQRGSMITSPVWIQGQGEGYEQSLVVRVLDATGFEIGKGAVRIDGALGEIGPYYGLVNFAVPASTQPGRIQVYSQSPGDGAIEALASVAVLLQGSGLDETIEQTKAALEDKDYAALARLMTDPWYLTTYRSASLSLSRQQALQQLVTTYLGPGQVFVDLSVDAQQLLAGHVTVAPDVTHVVYSTGWGANRSDDAFLLFGVDAAGRARWGGMIYISAALRPYAAP